MTNIEKAIEKEKEYLTYRMKGEEPFHLIEAVNEFGFGTLEKYFNAKREYEISNLTVQLIETSPEKAIGDVLKTISERKPALLLADTEYTLVWNGNNSTFNETYCSECNIPIYPLSTGGGTIVSTNGDLNIGICIPSSIINNAKFVLDKFVDIFSKYTSKTVDISGNDILVDGYKVLGSSTYDSNQMFMFITPVSFSDKTELISHICTKHSEKIPGFIDFMTRDELEGEVRTWLKV